MVIAYAQLWESALQRLPNRHGQLGRFFEKCHLLTSLQRLLLIRARSWGLVDPDALGGPAFIKADGHVGAGHSGQAANGAGGPDRHAGGVAQHQR